MASVVFAVIAFDSMEGSDAKPVLAAITLTVLVSVVAHGLSAAPLSKRYGEGVDALPEDAPERQDVPTLASRPQTMRRQTKAAPPRSASDDTHP
jgi:hypothetical protein